MPNLPSREALGQRNGHTHDLHALPQQPSIRSSKPASLPDQIQSFDEPADVAGNDWSSLTQDLMDTLPRAWVRGLLYLLIGFVGVVLPWAILAKVDQTGAARGRIEPEGQTYRLDAPVSGKVTAIAIKEGGTVKAGQVLMQLDTEIAKTDLQQAQAKLEGQLNRLTQLEQIKNQLAIATRTQRLQNQAQMAEQQAQINEVQQRLNANQRASTLLRGRLAKDSNEVQRYRSLWQEGVVPKIKVVEIERIADESQRSLEQAQADIKQSQAELTRQERTYDRVVRTGELAILDSQKQAEELRTQMADLQAQVLQTEKAIASLQLQLQQRTIHSPVAGTVFQLPIQQPGAVVQPGQMVAQIAPQGVTFIFKAQMLSSESGFLHVGMPVKLKFDAYPFQDYGVIPGHLSWISPDSKVTQTAQGNAETFELKIALEKNCIPDRNKCITLTPGQTATAEVVVRQRRIIDFLIDPFKKLQNGDFKL